MFLLITRRLLPRLISWYLIKKYKVHIQFGRISFPFSLRDVQIRKSGYAVVRVLVIVIVFTTTCLKR